MQRPSPTRHNLHAIEDRIEFGERGHDVLQRKLEALVFEFLDVFDRYESAHRDLVEAYEAAQSIFDRARAREGEIALEGIVRARKTHPTLTVTQRSIMGIGLPLFEASSITTEIPARGYGLLGTSSVVDEVVDSYEELLQQLVLEAELESALHVLLEEITVTRRRVNILEKFLLPRLRDQAEYIRRHLAEREREERIQQKWYKLKKDHHNTTLGGEQTDGPD